MKHMKLHEGQVWGPGSAGAARSEGRHKRTHHREQAVYSFVPSLRSGVPPKAAPKLALTDGPVDLHGSPWTFMVKSSIVAKA